MLVILVPVNLISAQPTLKNEAQALKVKDITSTVRFGHRDTPSRDVEAIVIHSTCVLSADSFAIEGVLRQFSRYGVCSHYIIARDGTIYKTVNEEDIAYHAGKSKIPATGKTGVNRCSIGIEIISSPYSQPTESQYKSLLILTEDILTRYPVKYILRHSDVAPGRKTDPWNFNWDRFKDNLSRKF